MLNKSEIKYIKDIEQKMSEYILSTYPKGKVQRDAHPKTLGLVKGFFKAKTNLPTALKIGVFKNENEYPTFVRFSSADHQIKSDLKKDVRGISLKVLNAEGTTQDFLLMSHPTMPFGTIKKFRDVIVSSVNSSLFLKIKWLCLNFKTYLLVVKSKKSHKSLSSISYWSTTTYKFGKNIVKYKLTPSVHIHQQFTVDKSFNRLKKRLKQELSHQEIVYDFCVQFYVNEKVTPTDDMSKKWNEKLSPFISVATLTIPKQIVKEQTEINNKITYSLENSLSAHKAMGKLNLARIKIYQKLSKLRHSSNNHNLDYTPTLKDFNHL